MTLRKFGCVLRREQKMVKAECIRPSITKALPEWLSRRLDTRRSFRVDADPSNEIMGLIVLGGRRMQVQLMDASQDGMAVLCSAGHTAMEPPGLREPSAAQPARRKRLMVLKSTIE